MKTESKTRRRRSRPLRVESDEVLWFVTCRVVEERHWLHPILTTGLQPPNRRARKACERLARHCDKRLENMVKRANARRGPHQAELKLEDAKRIARGMVGSVLARAQGKYRAKIYAVVVMSNHMHLVVRTQGKNLARFMGYVKSQIADAVNLLTGKRGPLWARRYDAQPILDDGAAAGRVAYTLDNPVSANLVEHYSEWPGLNLAYGMADADRLEFEYLDRTAWHRAGRPNVLAPFFRTAMLELSPLEQCEGLSRELCCESVTGWLKRAPQGEDQAAAPCTALGVQNVVHASFESRPSRPSFGRRPYAFGTPKARREHRQGVAVICGLHEQASERFRNGDRTARFPPGTYPPPLLQAA